MPGIGQPGEEFAAIEERFDELHIHQMRAAQIGVVDDINVAGLHVGGALDDGLGGELHGTDEDRQAKLALGD